MQQVQEYGLRYQFRRTWESTGEWSEASRWGSGRASSQTNVKEWSDKINVKEWSCIFPRKTWGSGWSGDLQGRHERRVGACPGRSRAPTGKHERVGVWTRRARGEWVNMIELGGVVQESEGSRPYGCEHMSYTETIYVRLVNGSYRNQWLDHKHGCKIFQWQGMQQHRIHLNQFEYYMISVDWYLQSKGRGRIAHTLAHVEKGQVEGGREDSWTESLPDKTSSSHFILKRRMALSIFLARILARGSLPPAEESSL